jgi:hypothetical protein
VYSLSLSGLYNNFYYWYYCTPAVKAEVDRARVDNEGTLDLFGIPKVDLNEADAEYILEKIKENRYNLKTLKIHEGLKELVMSAPFDTTIDHLITNTYLITFEPGKPAGHTITDGLLENLLKIAENHNIFEVRLVCFDLESPKTASNIEKLQQFAAEHPSVKFFIRGEEITPTEKTIEASNEEEPNQPVAPAKNEQPEAAKTNWLDKFQSLKLNNSAIELVEEYLADQGA